ncbi:uncharacterized mitochondrial protein-like protein [Tanacetum coccineum]
MDTTEFFRKLKCVCHWADPFKDLKCSNVPGIRLSSLYESNDTFSSLQALSDLYYLFDGFMDYLWYRELNISNFGPADSRHGNTCSRKDNSNSDTALSKSVKESSLDSETKDVHAIKYKMSKEKERCMTDFRSLHTFNTMFLNVDQLQKQIDKYDFQEDGSMEAFWVINRQFQKFIDSQFSLDYGSQMTDKYFVEYTRIEIDTGKALDVDLVVTESSRIESKVQDESYNNGFQYKLDLLFCPMFDELLNGTTLVVSKSSDVHAANAPDQRQQQNTTPSTSTTVAADTPPLNIQTTLKNLHVIPTELVNRPLCKNVINMKWLWKKKRDEENIVIRNKARLVAKGYSQNVRNVFIMLPLTSARLESVQLLERIKFEMSMMGELTLFLGIQIHQSSRGIFINQAKYAEEILKKHGMTSCDSIGTPMATKPLNVNLSGTPVDQTKYHSMVGELMFLIASRLDIVHATCYCALYQARPIEKHLKEVKRIFRYLKNTINMGLFTSGGIQCLGGDKLVSFSSKKYVSLSACCAQVL